MKSEEEKKVSKNKSFKKQEKRVNARKVISNINKENLKKKMGNIESEGYVRQTHIKDKNRNHFFKFLLILAFLIIIVILCFTLFIDTDKMTAKYEYSKNVSILKKELKKIKKQGKNEGETFINSLNSKITIDEEDENQFEVYDVLSSYKNEYTKSSIGLINGDLVYMGSDYELMKIANSKGIRTDYSIIKYSLNENRERYVFNEETGAIEEYTGSSKIIVVPSVIDGTEVKEISNYAFESSGICVVIIPDNIVSIGDNSFANNNIFHLEYSNNLQYIGDKAFYKNNLKEVTISENVKKVGQLAFAFNDIEKINILSKETKLLGGCFNQNKVKGDSAYIYNSLGENDIYNLVSYAGNDKNISVKEGVEKIENYAFYKTNIGYKIGNMITSISLPDTLKIIGNYAFENNEIEQVKIPGSVVFIGKNAFKNNNINKLKIDNIENVFLGAGCFNNNYLSDESAYVITNKAIPNGVTNVDIMGGILISDLEEYENYGTSEATSFLDSYVSEKRTLVSYAGKNRDKLLIPYSINIIADGAMADLGIKEIVIPSSVDTIGNLAFAGNNLSFIDIPETVVNIGYNAFARNNITKIGITGRTSIPETFDSTIKFVTDNIVYN